MLIVSRLNSEGWVTLLLPCQVCLIAQIRFCNNILAGFEFPPLLPSWNWQRLDVNKYPSSTMNCANGTWTWESSAEDLTQLLGVSQVLFQLTCLLGVVLAVSHLPAYVQVLLWRQLEEPWAEPAYEPSVNQCRQSHCQRSNSLLSFRIWQRGITFDSFSNDALGLTWLVSAAVIVKIKLIT